MGLFSSSSRIDQTAEYKNEPLRDYTSTYRGMSPWMFATLDPTAALAAMGKGTKIKGKDLGVDFKTLLKGMSEDEQKGAQAAQDALARIQQRQQSGEFLTPQETEFINTNLDKAFEYAHRVGYADWERGTQMLAGGRGLRTSDTPVGDVAMRELRNFELGLGSQRAQLGLDTTLKMSMQQQQFDESLREFQEQLLQNRWQARQGFAFGGGMSGAGNIAHTTRTTGTMTASPSLMTSIGQTIGVAQDFTKLAGTVASGASTGWSSMAGVK